MGIAGFSAPIKVLIAFLLTFILMGLAPAGDVGEGGEPSPGADVGAGGSRGYALDVGISKIDPLPVNPSKPTDFFPGQRITINVTVTNYGSKDIAIAEGNTFDVLVVVSDQSSYSQTEKKTIPALQSGSSFTLQFIWTPPTFPPKNSTWGSYPHTFLIHAYTLLEKDEDSGNNAMTKPLQILEPAFDPFLDYRDGSDMTQKGEVGAILYFEFTLYNQGESPDIILLDVTRLPEDWDSIPFDANGYNLDDHDNTSDRLRLTVFISDKRDFAMAGHKYEIVLRAKSLNYPLATDDISFYAEINFKPGVIITPPFEDAAFTPGTVQYIDFNITNNANDMDSYRVMVEIPTVAKLKLWDAHIQSGSTVGPLKRGETGTTTVMLTVPAGLWKGQSCNIQLTAQSMNPKSKNKDGREDTVYVLVRAGEVYGLDLSPYGQTPHVKPGRATSIPFNVTNTGNVKDSTMEWNFDPPPNWVCGLDLSLIPDGGLGQLNIATIELDAFVPSAEQFGTYYIQVWVYSGKDVPKKLQDEMTLTVIVDREYKVQLSTNTNRKEGEIGTVVNYKMKVKNQGNSDDTYNLSANSDWVVFTPQKVSVPYGQTQEVIASVHIPLNASGDTNPISRDHRDGYRIDMTARSQNNSGVQSTYQVEVLVEPYYNFEVRASVDHKTTTSNRETVVEFDLEVENFGNIADVIDFEVLASSSGDDWGVMRSIHRPVGLDRVEHVKFEAMPPMGTDMGVYQFDIRCVSQGSEDLVRRDIRAAPVEHVVSVFVDVTSLDLVMSNLSVNGDPVPFGTPNLKFTEDDSLVFSVEIANWANYNYTNDMHGDIVVKFFVDDMEKARRSANISFLPSGGTVIMAFQWPATLGNHQISIELDPADNIPESDESNNEQAVKATVYGEGNIRADKEAQANPFTEQSLNILLIILCVIGAVLMFWARTKIKELEEEETGYTEDGEYKPYQEAYEAFAEDGDRFESEAASDPEHPYSVPGVGKVTATQLYSSSGSPYGDATRTFVKDDTMQIDAAELALLPAAQIEMREGPGKDAGPARTTKPVRTTKPMAAKDTKIRTTKPVSAGPTSVSVDMELISDPVGEGLGIKGAPAPPGPAPAAPAAPAAGPPAPPPTPTPNGAPAPPPGPVMKPQ